MYQNNEIGKKKNLVLAETACIAYPLKQLSSGGKFHHNG